MDTIVCETCGKVVELSGWRKNRKQRFCSPACADQAKRGIRKKSYVTIECQMCHQTFEARPSWVKNGRKKYCSKECKNRYQSEVLRGKNSPRYGKPHTVNDKARMAQIARLKAIDRSGPKHPAWKGGRYASHGYMKVHIPSLNANDQALARPMVRKNGTYILEHRLVMARTLGRPLKRTEIVHHMNGDKLDNRPENLTTMENDRHSREHRKIDRELTKLREGNRRLKSLLMIYLPAGSDISSLLERI